MRSIDLRDRDDALAAIVACLRSGGVVVAPTETVYGLMTPWDNTRGRERIFELKARPAEKQLQMLALDLDMAARHAVCVDAPLRALAARFWPGPLTVVCATAHGGTIGLRLPAHALIRQVLAALQAPLAATSANRSGLPPSCTGTGALAGLTGRPDLLVYGERTPGTASTVVSLLSTPLRILRPGPVTAAQVQAALDASPAVSG